MRMEQIPIPADFNYDEVDGISPKPVRAQAGASALDWPGWGISGVRKNSDLAILMVVMKRWGRRPVTCAEAEETDGSGEHDGQNDHGLQVLRYGAQLLGLSVSAVQEQHSTLFSGEIGLFNRVYKLVAAEGDEMVVKHVLDSIAAVPVFRQLLPARFWDNPQLCDIGSGVDFLGFPLASCGAWSISPWWSALADRCGF